MATSPVVLVWCIAAPLALGALLLRALGLRPRDDRLGYPAWAWLLGSLLLGLILLACFTLGLPTRWWWTAPLAGAAGTGLAWRWLSPARHLPVGDDVPRLGVPYATLVATLVVLAVLALVAGHDVPTIQADEGNIWFLESKTLFLFPGMGEDFVRLQQEVRHPDYPLLNPLLQAWVHSQNGGVVYFANRVPVQLFAVALLLILAAALRRYAPPLVAALLLLVMFVSEHFQGGIRVAYSDLMVATGWVAAFDAWLRWRQSGRRCWLFLASACATFALWSKNEAMLHGLSLLCALLADRILPRSDTSTRVRPPAWCLVLPGAVVLVQVGFNLAVGVRSDHMGDNVHGTTMFGLMISQFGERIGFVADYAVGSIFDPSSSISVFAPFLLALVLVPRRVWSSSLRVPALAILLSVLGLHAVYVGSYLPVELHMFTSYERVMTQLVPVTLLWIATMLPFGGAAAAHRD